jgi:hypothetical protein
VGYEIIAVFFHTMKQQVDDSQCMQHCKHAVVHLVTLFIQCHNTLYVLRYTWSYFKFVHVCGLLMELEQSR